ncbi:hypothetical protein BT09F28_47320 [Escherichia coli]
MVITLVVDIRLSSTARAIKLLDGVIFYKEVQQAQTLLFIISRGADPKILEVTLFSIVMAWYA